MLQQFSNVCYFLRLRPKGFLEVVAGGSGATKQSDGLSGVQVHMTNTSNLPIEALEMEFPLLTVKRYALRTDSGGAGYHRGGLGIVREYEAMYDNIQYTGLGDRQKFPPWGLNGGKSGSGGAYYLIRKGEVDQRLTSKCTDVPLQKGDIISVRTPGAGGYGNPYQRPLNKVLEDVENGYVTQRQAESEYGVTVKNLDGSWKIDYEKTQLLRRDILI